jgi:hypothetical protein
LAAAAALASRFEGEMQQHPEQKADPRGNDSRQGKKNDPTLHDRYASVLIAEEPGQEPRKEAIRVV